MTVTAETTFLTRSALFAVQAYRQIVSPWLRPACRFVPTCSEYAGEAIEKFGIIRGGPRVLSRLLKCHPLHPGGVDFP